MAKKIEDIEGIGKQYGDALRAAGVNTVDELLDTAGDRKGRAILADKVKITEARLLEWVNHADLFRIKGIGSEYADLLEAAGVDTVAELKQRNAENLAAKMNEINEAKKLVRRAPNAKEVAGWIEQAAKLPGKVSH